MEELRHTWGYQVTAQSWYSGKIFLFFHHIPQKRRLRLQRTRGLTHHLWKWTSWDRHHGASLKSLIQEIKAGGIRSSRLASAALGGLQVSDQNQQQQQNSTKNNLKLESNSLTGRPWSEVGPAGKEKVSRLKLSVLGTDGTETWESGKV